MIDALMVSRLASSTRRPRLRGPAALLLGLLAASAASACVGTETGTPFGGDGGTRADASSADASSADASSADASSTDASVLPDAAADSAADGAFGCAGLDGSCSRGIGDPWVCHCAAHPNPMPSSQPSCEEALFEACAAPCAGGWGSCAPASLGLGYECVCPYYGAAPRLPSASSCEEALDECEPREGLCSDYSGYGDRDGEGFSCACIDGTGAHLSFAELGHDRCALALGATCPAVLGDAHECARIDADARAECVHDGFESPTFLCSCEAPGVARTQTVAAASCADALAAWSCP